MNHTLDSLPAELLYDIVSNFDPDTFHQSLLALSRAIPRSPVPTYLLFPKIHLKRGEQVFQLYCRLRNAPEDAALVQEFSFEDWTVDADIFVNLVALMPSLTYLKIFIGPNFAPEHLEEIFQKPRPQLRYLSMRFRPYVQRATYYQFLKGAYFDSTLLALSSWPSPTLLILSIVQDPLDPAIAPTNFAQPLVFFRLDPLSTLAASPMSNNLKHLRFRVPGRQVARHVHSALHSFPALHFLDLSTCNIGGHDLAQLLGHMRHVQAVVMDSCPIVSQRTDIQLDAGDPFVQWAELGEAIATAGLARAAEREKKLKAWTEAFYVRESEEDDSKKGKKAKRGRRGLATATISLRAPSPERKAKPNQELPPARVPKRNERTRILPPLPALSSLATSFPGVLTTETYDAVRAEFERGWAAGITRLRLVRARHLTSWHNGVSRVVQFAEMGSPEWKEEELFGEEGLVGLVDVKDETTFLLDIAGNGAEGTDGPARRGHDCPLLCIAGSKPDGQHVEGCGHRMGWDTYKDDI